jgi:uncharacterized coiled-coil protein SlyX
MSRFVRTQGFGAGPVRKFFWERKNMRPLTTGFVLVLFVIALSWFAYGQSGAPADKSAGSAPTGAAQEGATKDEVQQLRGEVAEQRKTIEELKAMVQQLAETSGKAADGAHLVNTNLVEPVETAQAAKPADKKPAEKKPAEKKSETPVVAGWSGEHFFIKSSDGKFQIQPYGYFQSDYRAYSGDGAPSNTFLIRRARFGFQGTFGTHYDYAVLLDAAASNGQPSNGTSQVSRSTKTVNVTWMRACSCLRCFWRGGTKSVQPYWKFATATMLRGSA